MPVTPSAGSSASGTASPLQWNHTVNSDENFLRVAVMVRTTGAGSVAVTYNGVSMTLEHQTAVAVGLDQVGAAEFWLLNPATGTNQVSVTITGTLRGVVGVANSMSGVHRTSPIGVKDKTTGAAGTNPSLTLTGTRGGSLVVDAMAAERALTAVTATAGAGQTDDGNLSAGVPGVRGAASHETGGGSVTMSWTLSQNVSWAQAAMEVRPPDLLTLARMGVGR